MMKTIYKYEIPLELHCDLPVEVPSGAEVIKIAQQGDQIRFWAKVDPNKLEVQTIVFRIYGTGQRIPDDKNLLHLETVLSAKGQFVWHVFVKIPE